jgi:hypothetical protein
LVRARRKLRPNDAGSEKDGSEEIARRLVPRLRLCLPKNSCTGGGDRAELFEFGKASEAASAQSKQRVRNRYCLIYRLAQAEDVDTVKLPPAVLRSSTGVGAAGV